MKNTLRHIHRHVLSHIKQHHKKYLFGVFGGFAVVKLFLLVLGLSVVEYTYNTTFAQLASGCTLTGQYYTWEYQTWGYLTGQELTWGSLVDCVAVSGYRTWGSLDESGILTWQTRVEESQTWCVLTGQTLSEWSMTWYYLTWGYRTWGYVTGCDEPLGTGDEVLETGNNQSWSSVSLWNGICESGDIIWDTPLSWSVVRNIFPIIWGYSWSDCLSGISLQLRDHNNQWISLGTFASWTTWYLFDSRRLYSFQQSGLYTILGNTGAWDFALYTGLYSGTYSRLFTWYTLRLLTIDQIPFYETSPFTIDNEAPTLSWITLLANWSATWYLTISGVVSLSFTASQELDWVQVSLWSGKVANSSMSSWLSYTYTWNITSLYPDGILAAHISFVDRAGNTGAVLYTWSLIVDTTRPILTGFVFSGNSGGVYLNFSSSEPVRYTLSYRRTWWIILSGMTSDYLTSQNLTLSWIERNQSYMFSLNVFDRAGNSRSVTWDLVQTNLWTLLSHVYISAVASESVLSWTLDTLANILKIEVEKFNACKDILSYTPIELGVKNHTFVLQMPMFKKSQVKTLVNAFTLFVLNKVKNDYELSQENVTEITKKFDNFLIILKLLRDDDNTCKQHLSNYHITQFRQALEEFNISVK